MIILGTWYETCSISHLPIRYKDETMIFYIKKKDFIHNEWSGGGEVDKWYTPIALPFSATLNIDENFENGNNEITKKINDIRRGEIEKYDIMFVLKPMYDAVISEMRTRNDMHKKFLQMANEFIEQSKTLDIKKTNFFGWDIDFAGNRFVDFYQIHHREMRKLLIELADKQDDDLKEKMIELLLFHYGLQVLRKMWHPGVGRGAQETEYFLHKKISELTIQAEEEQRKKWLEENILEEGESEEDITKTYLWYI